ncbi:GAF and ANTAR domain-containing protein [Nocardioides zeae]|uniref:GAF and ANTAR domain-containing protein n=1 Tax=Nocardioides imazamoxiresistens TaxID=3231893 RepID=A0ABU3PQE8_9ACTN|nr:GAF and ANTAR domain-containing protein [Nocardioides zeae]MDT9591451.1 GAF and ANTAR domain-containing protein [Nocardioides zeae]
MAPLDESAAFAALATEFQTARDPETTARTIVDRLHEIVPDADHVSLTLRRRGGFATLAASDARATQVDELQYALAEGPCVDAAATDPWIRSGDVGGDPRWPSWGPRARRLGIGSLLAVQLLRGDRPQGAINLYSERPSRFVDREVVDVALVSAVHAAHALTSARLVEDLETAMSSRHLIGMAQGVLMERFQLDEHASFEFLRRVSSAQEMKLRDTAAHLVRTRHLPGE